MTCKWIQPFPCQDDQGILELDSTAAEPWLDVEIVNATHCIAHFRHEDLKLGRRLEIQLQLAQQMACLLAPRFSGQKIRLQLHDEDPGVACLRIDAPLGADLESSPLIPDPIAWEQTGMRGSAINYAMTLYLPGAIDSQWCSGGAQQRKQNITPDNLELNLLSAVSSQPFRAELHGCTF